MNIDAAFLDATTADTSAPDTTAELRRAFDESFTRKTSIDEMPTTDLLMVRVGDESRALRLMQISALVKKKVITPVPTHHVALLGMTVLRGAIAPVYDLATLIGITRSAQTPWTVLSATQPCIALAFAAFEGHARVHDTAIISPTDADNPSPRETSPRETLHMDGVVIPVVDVAAIVDSLSASMPSHQGAMP